MSDDKDYPAPPYAPVTIPYQQFCNEDHCTVEERTAIEAVVICRILEDEGLRNVAQGVPNETGFAQRYFETKQKERKAIDALLAARSKSEV